MKPRVNIIITVLNALDLTRKAIESAKAVNYENKKIVVVDNHSEVDVRSFLGEELKKGNIDTLILNDRNKGFGVACNQGVNASPDANYICFFSNDIEGTDNNWLQPLVTLAEEKANVGAVGCRLIYRLDHPDVKRRGTIQHAGCKVKIGSYMDTPDHVVNEHMYRYVDPKDSKVNIEKKVEMVTAACFLMPKAVFSQVGGFDPIFRAGYCEDLDLNLRLRKAGYDIWYCPSSSLYHFEMIAVKTTIGGVAYRTLRTINQHIVDQRWLEFVSKEQHKYE